VTAGRLLVDHTYQRDPIQARVKTIADNLDLDALGLFIVSRRSDGLLYVIDGQHRIEALRHYGWQNDWKVECRIYEKLTVEQEAELYRQLNNTRPLQAWDFYKAGLISGDANCLEIDETVKSAGLKVAPQGGDGRIRCVTTLRQVHARYGKGVLRRALDIATGSWGHTAGAVEKEIVHGLSIVAATYNGELDTPWLIKKLAKSPGGPAGLLGRARGLKDLHTAPLYRIVAQQIVAIYNKGRRTAALPDILDDTELT
jgi:hypothetical protein